MYEFIYLLKLYFIIDKIKVLCLIFDTCTAEPVKR